VLAALSPERRLELRLCSADEVQAQLLGGRVDVGVSYRPLLAPGLESTVLAEEALALVGPPDSRPPPPEEVGALSFVTYEEFEYVFLQWFAHHGLPLPQQWRRGDHYEELEEVLAAVSQGRGWSIVPADAARAPASGARLHCRPPSSPPCANPVHLITRTGELKSADARWLRTLF